MYKKPNEHTISDACVYACDIINALDFDKDVTAPTITLRGQVKIILIKMHRRGLFTWYEKIGVWLLTRRMG
jgi:hypothetical protein